MIGIYKLTSPSGKIYIGQSLDIEKRWVTYRNGRAHSKHLRAALMKYGSQNFVYETLQVLEIADQNQLDYFEEYYITQYDALNPLIGYNNRHGGSRGKCSVETKKRMSEAAKGRIFSEETKKKISETHKLRGTKPKGASTAERSARAKGHQVSEETRKKISISRKGSKVSEETKKKISESRKLRSSRSCATKSEAILVEEV